MSHDVFISYSTKDKTIADAVCAKLEEDGIRAWIAPRDVPPGNNFAESIVEAIDTCKIFILIWSSNANTSEHILNEINQAFEQGIIIIPFRVEDVQPTRAMRYYIGRTHWLDAITPPLVKHIATLASTILVNLGREQKVKKPLVSTEPKSIVKRTKSVQKPDQSLETVISTVTYKGEETPIKLPGEPRKIDEAGELRQVSTPVKKVPRIIPVIAAIVIAGGVLILWSLVIVKGEPGSAKNQEDSSSGLAEESTVSAVTDKQATSPAVYYTKTTNPENQHSYTYFRSKRTWKSASDYCKSQSGYLVSIESANENRFVFDLACHTPTFCGHTWLGATDELVEGVWVWESGEPFEFQSWQYGHGPEYSEEKPENEADYLRYYSEELRTTWWDVEDDLWYFVCEWDPD